MTLALCTNDCPAWLAPFAALDLPAMFTELTQRDRHRHFVENDFPNLFEVLGEQLLVLDQLATELPDVNLDHVRQLALLDALLETRQAWVPDDCNRHVALMAEGEAGKFPWPLFRELREGKTWDSRLLEEVTVVATAQWRLRVGPIYKGYTGSDKPTEVALHTVSNPVLYGKLLVMVACSEGLLALSS